MAPARRNVIGAGLAAVGLAGGVAVSQVLLRRHRRRDDDVPAELPTAPADGLPIGTEVRFFDLSDGAQMRVLLHGTGPPVVLLHGVTLAADVWFHQLRDLADAGFRVVAPDLRGHGRSTIGTGGLRLDRVADDVAEVLGQLDLDGVILVGHSLGGMLALRLLTRDEARPRPEGPEPHAVTVRGPVTAQGRDARSRVVALGLVATSASPVVGRGVPGVRAVISLAGPLLGATGRLTELLPGPSLPDADFGDPLARITFGSRPSAPDVRLIRRITSCVPARIAGSLLLQLVSFDAERYLGRVSVPTTVVVGTGDVMTPVGHARTLADAIPDAELVVLADCGHMVMMERPEELALAVLGLAKRAGVEPLRR